jgi:hypothetical protein
VTKIGDSILDYIGNTPLVRLNAIPKSAGIECEMLAKVSQHTACAHALEGEGFSVQRGAAE